MLINRTLHTLLILALSLVLASCGGKAKTTSTEAEVEVEETLPGEFEHWSEASKTTYRFMVALHKQGNEAKANEFISAEAKRIGLTTGKAKHIDDLSIVVLDESVNFVTNKANITIEMTGTLDGIARKGTRVVSLVFNDSKWAINQF